MNNWFRGLLLALSLSPLACGAQATGKYSEGKEFKKVGEIVVPADPKKVTVEEFFSYGCNHCFNADPAIEAWKATKAADVDFKRVPHTLGSPVGALYARAFYAAEVLGVGDKIHKPLFDAIHVTRQPLGTPEAMRALFETAAGVKPAAFDSAMASFMVDSHTRRADQLIKTYQVSSVPTLVVGGKYTTSATLAGSSEKAMKVVDFLVEKIKKERK